MLGQVPALRHLLFRFRRINPFVLLLTFAWAEREIKSGALVQFRLGPGVSAVLVKDALDGGQPDARALKILRAMQSLKNSKQFIGEFHAEAYAVVAHEDDGMNDT